MSGVLSGRGLYIAQVALEQQRLAFSSDVCCEGERTVQENLEHKEYCFESCEFWKVCDSCSVSMFYNSNSYLLNAYKTAEIDLIVKAAPLVDKIC